jgi:hypothetical protein
MAWFGGSEMSTNAAGAAIALECEDFLAGRYAELLSALGRPLVPWACLNQAAHAGIDAIRKVAANLPDDAELTAWEDVRAVVATIVVAAVETSADLAELQRSVLVPLELELLANPPASPDALVRKVFRALW